MDFKRAQRNLELINNGNHDTIFEKDPNSLGEQESLTGTQVPDVNFSMSSSDVEPLSQISPTKEQTTLSRPSNDTSKLPELEGTSNLRPMIAFKGDIQAEHDNVFLSTQIQGRLDDAEQESEMESQMKSRLSQFKYTLENSQTTKMPAEKVRKPSHRKLGRKRKNVVKNITQHNISNLENGRIKNLLNQLSGKHKKVKDIIKAQYNEIEEKKHGRSKSEQLRYETYNSEEWREIKRLVIAQFPQSDRHEFQDMYQYLYGNQLEMGDLATQDLWAASSQVNLDSQTHKRSESQKLNILSLSQVMGDRSLTDIEKINSPENEPFVSPQSLLAKENKANSDNYHNSSQEKIEPTDLNDVSRFLENDSRGETSLSTAQQKNIGNKEHGVHELNRDTIDLTQGEGSSVDESVLSHQVTINSRRDLGVPKVEENHPPKHMDIQHISDIDISDTNVIAKMSDKLAVNDGGSTGRIVETQTKQMAIVFNDLKPKNISAEIRDCIKTEKDEYEMVDSDSSIIPDSADEHSTIIHLEESENNVFLSKNNIPLLQCKDQSDDGKSVTPYYTPGTSPQHNIIDLTQESFKAVGSLISPLKVEDKHHNSEVMGSVSHRTVSIQVPATRTGTLRSHTIEPTQEVSPIKYRISKDEYDNNIKKNIDKLPFIIERIEEDIDVISDSEEESTANNTILMEISERNVLQSLNLTEVRSISPPSERLSNPILSQSVQELRSSARTTGLKSCRSKKDIIESIEAASQVLTQEIGTQGSRDEIFNYLTDLIKKSPLLERIYTFQAIPFSELVSVLIQLDSFANRIDEQTIRDWADHNGISTRNN